MSSSFASTYISSSSGEEEEDGGELFPVWLNGTFHGALTQRPTGSIQTAHWLTPEDDKGIPPTRMLYDQFVMLGKLPTGNPCLIHLHHGAGMQFLHLDQATFADAVYLFALPARTRGGHTTFVTSTAAGHCVHVSITVLKGEVGLRVLNSFELPMREEEAIAEPFALIAGGRRYVGWIPQSTAGRETPMQHLRLAEDALHRHDYHHTTTPVLTTTLHEPCKRVLLALRAMKQPNGINVLGVWEPEHLELPRSVVFHNGAPLHIAPDALFRAVHGTPEAYDVVTADGEWWRVNGERCFRAKIWDNDDFTWVGSHLVPLF